MEINKRRLQELYEQEQSKTLAAKAYCEEVGIVYDESFRKKANSYILKSERVIDEDLENISETDTNQYEKVSSLSALKEDGTIMSIKEYCEFYKIPFADVRTYKLVTHTGKGAYYNIASNQIEGGHMESFHKKILEDISNIPNKPKTINRVGTDDLKL